jgi:hypothetical protein
MLDFFAYIYETSDAERPVPVRNLPEAVRGRITVCDTWRVGRPSSRLLGLAADNQASRQGCFVVRLALFACPLYSCGKKNERSGR